MSYDSQRRQYWIKETTIPQNRRLIIDKELLRSPAFCALTGIAKHMLLELYTRLKLDTTGKKQNKKYFASNNGKLEISYLSLQKKFGFSPASISKGLDRLAACGFIDIVELGCGVKRLSHKIALIKNWRAYGTDDFIPGEGKASEPVNGGFKKRKAKKNLKTTIESEDSTTMQSEDVETDKQQKRP